MDLQLYRQKIDAIDKELVALFVQRMSLSAQIAAYKKEHDLPIHDHSRELEILHAVSAQAGPQMDDYTKSLYTTIFELSKLYQQGCI